MYEPLGMGEAQTRELTEGIAAEVPMRRLGTPAGIVRAIAFLAGPDASYITREELTLNGGMSRL